MTSTFRFGWLLFVVSSVYVLSCSGDDDGGGGGGGGGGADAFCKSTCDRTLDCPNDPDPACMDECRQLYAACPTEARAFGECGLARPDSDFECDDYGETALVDGVCDAEATAVIVCAFSAQ